MNVGDRASSGDSHDGDTYGNDDNDKEGDRLGEGISQKMLLKGSEDTRDGTVCDDVKSVKETFGDDAKSINEIFGD
ncbi:unnamed protein product, partial [Rotaria sp. Silwood2]